MIFHPDGHVMTNDPLAGIFSQFFVENDGTYVATETQDAEAIVELNKAQYNSVDERARFGDEVFNKVASIPMVIFMDLERKGITRDKKAFMRWLDDPENRHFRTRPGKLSK